MRLLCRRLAVLILLVAGCACVQAQEAGPLRLDLATARRLAFERNPEILSARSEVDLASAQRTVAREFPNPVASLSVSKIPASSGHGAGTALGNGLGDRSYDSVAGLSQLIEIGGKRSARKAGAAAGLKAQEQRLADARRQMELAVVRAYVGVLTADEQARILSDSAASLRRESEMAQIRVKAGDISTNDRVQIEIVADRFQLEAERALSEGTNARVQLTTLLGEPKARTGIILTDTLSSLSSHLPPSPGISEELLALRPDVGAAEAFVLQADAGLRLQKAMRVPDPTVSLLYEHEPPDQPHTVGLGLSFPLPLWNRNRGNIAAARAMKDQAQFNAMRISAQASAEAAMALRDFESALSRRDVYETRIAPKAAAVRETVSFAYQKGGASLLDLLSAQRNDNEVRMAAAQAAAEVIVSRTALATALNEKFPTTPNPSKP